MKRLLIILLAVLLLPAGALAQDEKKALMLTVFGTSTEATITFDELVPMVQKRFPEREVFVPYTSGIIRNKLNAGISDPAKKILSPAEMLEQLKSSGYTNIAVASTIIFPGIEHEKLLATAQDFSAANSGIKISYTPPLLSDKNSMSAVVKAIGKYMLADGSNIVVAHGTHDGHPVEKTYMDLAVQVAKTYPHARVASVEGVPDIDLALDWAARKDADKLRFIVFMFVAGDHAQNDIASDEEDSFFTAAKQAGKVPSVAWIEGPDGKRMASLGLDPDYRKILLDYYTKNIPQ